MGGKGARMGPIITHGCPLNFANPHRFLKIARRVEPLLWVFGVLLTLGGVYWGLFLAPQDYLQGDSVRILYIHVPAAWLGVGLYALMAAMGVCLLVWKHTLAECGIWSCAVVGALFTVLCLITGSLWGKPTWGAWWVWDARLTSMLVLLFLYLGVLALMDSFADPARGARSGGLLAIIGVINLPIIKFSVDWWATLHQPASLLRSGGSAIHPSLLYPLLTTAAGMACLAGALIVLFMRGDLESRRVFALALQRRRLMIRQERDR